MVLPNSLSSYYEKFLTTGEVKCIDEEIPFEIPKGWEWARINAIGVSQLGKTLDRGKESGKEYPYLCSINVYWDSINLSKIKTFRLRDDELPKYKLRKGDLLICEGGDYGRCCIWDRNEDMYYQNALHRVRFHGGLIPSFYKYVFELYRNIGYIVGQGQTIKHFTYENMRSILFPVPSIHEQKRIVSRIEEIQPIVKKYQRTEDALKRLNTEIFDKLKKSILQEAIQGKLVSQITEEGTAQELLKQIKTEKEKLVKKGKLKKSALTDSVIYKGDDNKYWEKKGKTEKDITDEIPFEIPDSWAWVRLSSISDIIGGYAFQSSSLKEEHGKRVIRISDINEKGFVNTKIVRYNGSPISDIYKLQRFDILMAMTGGTVGKSLFVRELPEDELLLNQRVARIRNLWISVDYLNFVIIAPHIKEFISKQKNSTNDNISMADISNFLIPLPSIKEQLRIVEKLYNLASIMRG